MKHPGIIGACVSVAHDAMGLLIARVSIRPEIIWLTQPVSDAYSMWAVKQEDFSHVQPRHPGAPQRT